MTPPFQNVGSTREVPVTRAVVRIERQVRFLAAYSATLTLVLVVLGVSAFRPKPEEPGIIRALGLVIVDEEGRERILLGAPVPEARNRVRTDPGRVREAWGARFPAAYFNEYYPTYRHDMNGLLILDENGFDRLVLGDPTPDPNIGRRIARSSGLLINDAEGFERSGYALLKVNDRNRVVLGLDSDRGTEGVVLALEDGGMSGLFIQNREGQILLGTDPPDGMVDESFHGLRVKGRTREHLLNLADSTPPSPPE
jgi:hypothetical protein